MSKYQLKGQEKKKEINPHEQWPGVIERSRSGELTEVERAKALQFYKQTPEGQKYFTSLPVIWGDNYLPMGHYDEKYNVFYPTAPENQGAAKVNQGDVEVLKSREQLNDLFKRRGIKADYNFLKFAEGGQNPYESSDFNNIIMGMVSQYNSLPQDEDYIQQDTPVENYYDDPRFDELTAKMEELQEKINSYSSQSSSQDEPDADVLFDYVMNGSESGIPIDWTSVQAPQQSAFAPTSQGATSVDAQIAAAESGGNYKALNPNSSAVGKYQFLWNTWGKEIANTTGVSSKEAFRNNPQAQEDFYSYYKNKHMKPGISRLQRYNSKGLSEEELAKLYHFKGEGGAIEWLTKGVDRTQQNNMSINKYLGR